MVLAFNESMITKDYGLRQISDEGEAVKYAASMDTYLNKLLKCNYYFLSFKLGEQEFRFIDKRKKYEDSNIDINNIRYWRTESGNNKVLHFIFHNQKVVSNIIYCY